ncbi:hypothetical protein SAMN04488546_0585 [Geodermatophilus poikilotrophus]|uniref:Uncharacterized protein n=1 Tax=Geodermatophilus poikilotrophus TaxID=1333667 RepID=A0A1H9ZHJ8_9ACTN|nr:hypothetical protein SAMN04488546_0585 [Geodermatophilus poikilotrophus]
MRIGGPASAAWVVSVVLLTLCVLWALLRT